MNEVIYPDGSMSTFTDGGGSFHDGGLAIERMRLISAKHALRIYIESNGAFQLTRNGAHLAIKNVIEPLTGKKYKRSMDGKREAYSDCVDMLYAIEDQSVIY